MIPLRNDRATHWIDYSLTQPLLPGMDGIGMAGKGGGVAVSLTLRSTKSKGPKVTKVVRRPFRGHPDKTSSQKGFQ